jgi:peptide/nickel transport system substrate-binding protein
MPEHEGRNRGRGLTMGTMNRRTFVGGASVLGLAAGPLSLAGSAQAAVPKSGGRLRVGVTGAHSTDTLDPSTFEDAFTQLVGLGCIYNCLTEIDGDGNLVPELAESWEGVDGAKRWVFQLRQEVEFHNGKTLDANDVVASINFHRSEDSTSAAKPLVAPITSITADGSHTVVFELSAGNADFPYLLSDYHLAILPADGDRLADPLSGIGTGGYTVAEFQPGVRILTKRNPNYWKAGRAHFDEVEIIGINDTTARTNALLSGQVDLMNRCDLKTFKLLERKQGVALKEVTGTRHFYYPMLTQSSPLNNTDVRMALKLAVDREAMLQLLLQGHGALGNDHPIGAANRFHAADIPQRQYDPEKAKWHLKQAGAEGLKIQLHAGDIFDGAVDSAVLFREHAAEAGIDIDVVRQPTDGYWSDVWLKKPFIASYSGGRATADWMFTTTHEGSAPWNDTQWNHDRFNRLLHEARVELDEAKRAELYREMQLIARDEGGNVIPVFANYVFGSSDKLQHGTIAANWDLDGFKAPERWWFA